MRIKFLAFIASTLSGLLAAAAFPPLDISGLIWVALVPYLYLLTRCRPLPALGYTFLFCLVFHTGIFFWMFRLSGYTFLHHILLGLMLSIWLGAAAIIVNLVSRRFGPLPALVVAPFAWVIYEWLRSNVGFLSLPWGLLGHSQYNLPALMQSAAIAGVWGLSALIVAVNSALTAILYPVVLKLSHSASASPVSADQRKAAQFAIMVAGLFIANLGYGYWVFQEPPAPRSIRIAAVQGNIPQHEKWDDARKADIMAIYSDLSVSAGNESPDLIIWPETATPRSVAFDLQTYRYVKDIADQTGAILLLGSARVQKFKHRNPEKAIQKNSAFLLFPGKNLIQQRYDKIILLPFAEYLPLASKLPWHWLHIPDLAHYTPGSSPYIFFTKDFRFAAPICWETIFPGFVRTFADKGAQFIVNISNEAWFGKSAAPYHFLAMNVFRAVENRRSVVRCANTGISCIIDPRGQVVKRVRDGQGADTFVRGVLVGDVALNDNLTFYTRWGDWFIAFALALLFILLMSFHLRRSRPNVDV
jgi:apolipoprotein N-acyltransferase